MKKSLAILIFVCLLLTACTSLPQSDHPKETTTKPLGYDTATSAPAETSGDLGIMDVTVTEGTNPSLEVTVPPTVGNPSSEDGKTPATTQPSATDPKPTENINQGQKDPLETKPPETTPPTTTPPTEPTDPVVPPTNPVTQPTTPTEETKPSQPVEDPTEPGTSPGETNPTEPPACDHDWKHIHHPEEGHWLAGIVCDCGWTAYGDADDLLALWKAHYASYPAVEALFNHGGYGSMDEWIVDTPAYDEWVCCLCGEMKE